MREEHSYGIIPIFTDEAGTYRFLLAQHAQAGGHWSFPKGHVEEGETPLETARRELFEETGISDCVIEDGVSFEERYTIHRGEDSAIAKTVTFFIGFCPTTETDIRDTHGEIAYVVWLPYEDALKKITYAESQNILKKAFNHITKKSS